jgi:hypothetical protein
MTCVTKTLYDWCRLESDRFCGLVVEFLATDPEEPGSIIGAARYSEK